ncbi:MAG TPA: NADH-quinone oxidoreductase subunit L [Gemmatimonadaceae bacterium]|nr:NADH-quinone oxidoreductase subunit L [Gemmatimonadaceae bacterium]
MTFPLLLEQVAAATTTPAGAAHPLAGTAAHWIWLVLLLPLAGAAFNGILGVVTDWRPGPFDPDPVHTGEFPIPSRTLVERAERATPLVMTVIEGHRPRPQAETPGDHGDHHDEGDDAGSHAPPARHPFLGLVSIVGTGVLAAAFGVAVAAFLAMLRTPSDAPYVATYWEWMAAGTLHVPVAIQLDHLSIVMTLVITGVGTLIHLFSTSYMKDDGSYARYFAYLNLFVFFMLLLVLAANYAVMFVGWEGVGLCSYLLIGFWFTEKANADAGKKAFIVNRIGDFGFLVAMFLMFWNFKSLDFVPVLHAAAALPVGTALATTIALFLFLGCTGKSAQIPLYVWLPDAMAGPTPVSALIHAATMVTAGVYLIARSGAIFAAAPVASLTVVVIGALTATFAASIGLKQWDIKKVLAYSTVSQLGYMFVGVGAGAYAAGVFHLVTHAFFKALLFLGAGAVIHVMHHAFHETDRDDDAQDMRNMGGLRRYMPITFATMWAATLAISGIIPFAGFFSKDGILGATFAQAHGSELARASWLGVPGSAVLYAAYVLLLASAFMTAVYMTRMMLYTFHGPNRTGEGERHHLHEAPLAMTVPLVVLGILSTVGGWLNVPPLLAGLGPVEGLTRWLEPVVGGASRALQAGAAEPTHGTEWTLVGAAVLVAVAGIALAVVRLKPGALVPKALAPADPPGIERLLANKYYVDEAYDAAVVEPVLQTSRKVLYRGLDVGIIDRIFVVFFGFEFPRLLSWAGSRLQSGRVGNYAWALLIGVVVLLGAFTLR